VSPYFDALDAEVIRAKRVFLESKNTILAARDDLDRHHRWLERFIAQAVSPSVSKRVDQRTHRRRISSGDPFGVVQPIGSLLKRRILLSTLGAFGISLLAMAVILGNKSDPGVLPESVVPKIHDTPQSLFVGQAVVKTSRRVGELESVVSPARGPKAPAAAVNPLPTKVNIKSKLKRPGNEPASLAVAGPHSRAVSKAAGCVTTRMIWTCGRSHCLQRLEGITIHPDCK